MPKRCAGGVNRGNPKKKVVVRRKVPPEVIDYDQVPLLVNSIALVTNDDTVGGWSPLGEYHKKGMPEPDRVNGVLIHQD